MDWHHPGLQWPPSVQFWHYFSTWCMPIPYCCRAGPCCRLQCGQASGVGLVKAGCQSNTQCSLMVIAVWRCCPLGLQCANCLLGPHKLIHSAGGGGKTVEKRKSGAICKTRPEAQRAEAQMHHTFPECFSSIQLVTLIQSSFCFVFSSFSFS